MSTFLKKVYAPLPSGQFNYYTKVPNVFFDKVMRKLPPSEYMVLMLFVRKLYGFHKNTDMISVSQIVKLTSTSKNTIKRALSGLESKGLITVVKTYDARSMTAKTWRLNCGHWHFTYNVADGNKIESDEREMVEV